MYEPGSLCALCEKPLRSLRFPSAMLRMNNRKERKGNARKEHDEYSTDQGSETETTLNIEN